jgi:hypothetical protein
VVVAAFDSLGRASSERPKQTQVPLTCVLRLTLYHTNTQSTGAVGSPRQPYPCPHVPITVSSTFVVMQIPLTEVRASTHGLASPSITAATEPLRRLRHPTPLATLPFPLGWQLICDCLTTPDIMHLAQTSTDHLGIGFAMVQHVVLRLEGNDDNDSTQAPSQSTTMQLSRLLARCTHFETLSCWSITPVNAACLGRALYLQPSLPRLRVLALTNAGLGVEGLRQLLPCLMLFPALEKLLLDGNALGNRGVQALAWCLRGGGSGRDGWEGKGEEGYAHPHTPVPCQRLKVLSLASNGIGAMGARELALLLAGVGHGAAAGSSILSGCLSPFSAHPPPYNTMQKQQQTSWHPHACALLESLCLDGNVLGPTGTVHLARAFRSGACAWLQQLHLRNNDVRGEGLRELLSAFAAGACPRLAVLSLESNMFGTAGARLLAHALTSGACAELLVLNLNFTFIGEHGTRALAEAFGRGACRRIQKLYLKSACLRRAGTLDHLLAATTATVGGGGGMEGGRGERGGERREAVLVL